MNSNCQLREICNQCLVHVFQLHTTLCSLAYTVDVHRRVCHTWMTFRQCKPNGTTTSERAVSFLRTVAWHVNVVIKPCCFAQSTGTSTSQRITRSKSSEAYRLQPRRASRQHASRNINTNLKKDSIRNVSCRCYFMFVELYSENRKVELADSWHVCFWKLWALEEPEWFRFRFPTKMSYPKWFETKVLSPSRKPVFVGCAFLCLYIVLVKESRSNIKTQHVFVEALNVAECKILVCEMSAAVFWTI